MPPENAQPELLLLARMRKGDESAFVALYRRHCNSVHRLALLYCGSAAQAADVTQDTFIHLMTRPEQFDPARGTVGAWLCGVARNFARKAARWPEEATDPAALADDTLPDEAHVDRATPLERLLENERAEQIRRALGAIAPHYRDVLILCELSELSYAEAAQLCGIDIGTVRSRLWRARAQFAKYLAHEGLLAGRAVEAAK
ncbi:MAG: RNA polymerase sigma factor [Bacillota bacterium]